MKYDIYLDNASTTKIDDDVLNRMLETSKEYYNPSSLYSEGKKVKNKLNSCRKSIATIINAEDDEIIFTSGGSESNNLAIKGYLLNFVGKGYHIITSKIEHSSVLNTFLWLEKMGFEVTYLDVNEYGEVSIDDFKNAIKQNTIFASIMLVNNEIGTIQKIKELAKFTKDNNVVFHTDAVQAAGNMIIDVKELGCDMLSASAHKFNGPKGCGFLYKSNSVNIEPIIHGGQQERGIRGGTENLALVDAMTLALKKSMDKLPSTELHYLHLRKLFIDKLKQTNIDFIINESENVLSNIISVSFKDFEGEVILNRLALKGIYISTGSACDSTKTELSHVIQAIGISDDYAFGTVRISLGKHNTEDDMLTVLDELTKIL